MIRLVALFLIFQFSTTFTFACSDPMTSEQISDVRALLTEMMAIDEDTPTGQYHHKGEFQLDECRNISVSYGSDTHTGKLHQLFTELNSSHHRSAYFGLVPDDDWSVYSNGILVFHQEEDRQKMAEWLFEMNRRAVDVLHLAGYSSDPSIEKRADLLSHSMDTFGRPQFIDTLRFTAQIWNSANSGCNGEKQTCLSDCKQLPVKDPSISWSAHVWGGAGPRMQCESQCQSICN